MPKLNVEDIAKGVRDRNYIIVHYLDDIYSSIFKALNLLLPIHDN